MTGSHQRLLSAQVAGEGLGDEIELASVFRFLRRRIVLILGICALVTGVVALVVQQLTPRYTAQAVLMLDARKLHVTNVEAVLSGLPAETAVLRSELDVLNSVPLMRRVANRLDLYSNPLINPPEQEGTWDRLRGWLEGNPLREWLASNPFVDPPEQEGTWAGLRGWLERNLPEEWSEAGTVEADARDETEPRDLAGERRRVINRLLGGLETEIDSQSYTIRLRYTSPDPVLSAKVVNTLADQYMDDQLGAKFEAHRRANEWLAQRLEELRTEIRVADIAVRDYREQNDMIEPRGTAAGVQQLADLQAQLIVAQVERSQAESRLAAARAGNPVGLRDVEGATILRDLRFEEAGLRRREAELSTRYGPRHPEMINVQAELDNVRAKLREETGRVIQTVGNEVGVARAKEAALRDAVAELRQRSGSTQRAEVELNELVRQAESARVLYENFLARYRETSDQMDLERADARIIAEAEVPERPSFPRPALMMSLGAVLGLLLGLMVAALVELLDRGFRLSEQVERQTGLPVLGVEPLVRTRVEPSAYALSKPFSTFSEALRTLRVALQFTDVEGPHQVVMVTSAAPAEGKTSLCLSLGRMAAKAGVRTLIVEADMRRPRMAQLLQLEPEACLADVLAGTRETDAAMTVDESSGVHVITSESGVENPTELLASPRMKAFLETMKRHYDLVIVDTPPVMAVADAGALARATDAVVFVVRWAETPRDTVKAALRQLAALEVPVTGIVLSQVDLRRLAAYGSSDYGRYAGYHTD